MIIGRITDAPLLALRTQSDKPCMLYNFALTPDPSGLSFESMPDSAHATPGRYLLEMARRLRERHPNERITLINPLYKLDIIHFLKVVALIQTDCPATGSFIVAEKTGRPLAYVLDQSSTEFTLSLVSTVSASLDSALLSKLLGEPVQLLATKWRLGIATRYTRFYSVANFEIYCWLAQHALDHLHQHESPPRYLTAIMPYHAGDALFFALAATRVASCIRGVAICRAYADIIKQHAPEFSVVHIDMPSLSSNGLTVSEEDYFLHHLKKALPEENLYAYLRPSGDYNRTNFHLIDHFAFALGASPRHAEDLVWSHSNPPRRLFRSAARVLLHFDAGWPMKIYPEEEQKRLIELLLAEGYQITVLTRTDAQYANYRSVAFHSHPKLLDLINEHDIIIGMDSFPAHLTAHSLGLPTICLFSSTRPENSNAPPGPYYAYMEKGLPCRPCHAKTRCPVYGGNKCQNFVSPEEIVSKMRSMLKDLSTFPLGISSAITPTSPKLPCAHLITRSVRTVWMEQLDLAIAISYLNPLNSLGYIVQASSELFTAWRRQGMSKALFKSARFALRQILRVLRK